MSKFVSYYELCLRSGVLLAHLGSGAAGEMMDRRVADPSLRICVQEPEPEFVKVRVRCGVATLGPTGIQPVAFHDESEQRGAWARLLPIGSRVISDLNKAWQRGRLTLSLDVESEPSWLELTAGTPVWTSASEVRDTLIGSPLRKSVGRLFVRVSGTQEEIKQMFSLIAWNVEREIGQ